MTTESSASIEARLAAMPAEPVAPAPPVSPDAEIDAKLATMPAPTEAPVAATAGKTDAGPADPADPVVTQTKSEEAKPSVLDRVRQRNAERLKAATEAELAKRAKVTEAKPATPTIEEIKALAAKDPLKAIDLLGLDQADFVSNASAAFLGLRADQEEAPATEPQGAHAQELAAVRAELKEAKELAAKAAADAAALIAEQQKAVQERQQAEVHATVAAEFAPLQERHPRVAALGDAAAKSVWGVMAAYHAQYGVIPPVAVAAKYLEQELQAQAPASATKPKSDVTPKAMEPVSTKPALQDAFKNLPLDPRARMKAMLELVETNELPSH